MQAFINVFTWDLIAYACASVFHSLFIMVTGYLAALVIL